jgi:hypothetical protein
MNTGEIWSTHQVASKRHVIHGCTMIGRGFSRARRLLPTTRRERALVAKLNDARASLAATAAVVRTFSALEDARAHLIVKAGRERRSGATKDIAHDPALTAFQGLVTTHIDSAVAQSKRTAEILDRVAEALERLAASLQNK